MANIASLIEVRTWLRFPNPATPSPDDMILQWIMNAADQVIQYECGDILPTRYDEYYNGGAYSIHLRHIPVLSVQNVEESWGYIAYELDYQQVNSPTPSSLFSYSIDSFENGMITRRSAGNVQIPFRPGTSNIRVQYTTGTEQIPGAVFTANLDLIAHWYQNSLLRAVAQAGTNVQYDAVQGAIYTRDTESGTQNLNIGVPYRILEQLKSNRHMPFFA